MHKPMIIRTSRGKHVLLLLACAGFVAGGAAMAVHAQGADVWIGWLCVLFFGAGIPLSLRELLDFRPRVILDDRGVLDRTLGVGRIPWSDIRSAYAVSVRGNHFVCLVLRNPEAWVSRLSGARRALVRANEKRGFEPLSINLSGTSADPARVQRLVLERCAAAGQLLRDDS